MIPIVSKIIKRKILSRDKANSLKEIIYAKEIRESKINKQRKEFPFVVKYFREPMNKVLSWQKISQEIISLGIPCAELLEVTQTSKGVFAKQRDFTKSLKKEIFEARFNKLDKKQISNLVLDLAKLHKKGFVLKSGVGGEHLFTPWIIYKHPNGELKRAIIDFGSFTKHDSQNFVLQNIRHARSLNNIEILLPRLVSIDKKFAIEIMKKYFEINPNPILKSKASTFLGHNF